MIPGTTGAIVGFLFFVAPGLVWELGRERKRPALEGSTFREISRVALMSVVFTVSAIGVLALVRTAWPEALVDVEQWIRRPRSYERQNLDKIAWSAVAELVIACALAWAFSGFPMPWKRGNRAAMVAAPVTWTVLSDGVKDCVPFVSARCTDGATYTGRCLGVDVTGENRYMALCPPITVARGGRDPAALDSDWKRLLLPVEDVRVLTVKWVPAAGAANAPGATEQ